MRSAVENAWLDFNTPVEAFVTYMYLDVEGLVTTGVGNLIDPFSHAASLPWKRQDGSLASLGEVQDAWNTVKSHQEMRKQGGGVFARLTSIRLSKDDVLNLVRSKLQEIEARILSRFPSFESWPADAQLGVLSMAWAAGPNIFAKFPRFSAAANKLLPDFSVMAEESKLSEDGNPGVKPRNVANKLLFENAAAVLNRNLDVEQLYYPNNAAIVQAAVGGVKFANAVGLAGVLGFLGWHGWKRWKREKEK